LVTLAWVDGADKLAALNTFMIVVISVANSQCSVVDLAYINNSCDIATANTPVLVNPRSLKLALKMLAP
jgi:hypothetical protein